MWLQSPLRLGVLFLAVGRIEFLVVVGLRSSASGDSTVLCPMTLSRPCSVIFEAERRVGLTSLASDPLPTFETLT